MGTRLHVGDLARDTDDSTLRKAFEEGGRTVEDLHIVTDRDTGPRGFAFVQVGSSAAAQDAITAVDGPDLDGRNRRVNGARERRPRGGGGRSGGGGRR